MRSKSMLTRHRMQRLELLLEFNNQTLDLSLYDRIARVGLSICNSFDDVRLSLSHRLANRVAYCLAHWLMDGNVGLDFGLAIQILSTD
ncbi:hypothetical protein PVK06_002406 [Gossypium arboreum]|uniref:Uncharacterized protein n=1 Tax=Gossypium arboreum TaxID=29729 RepID=A0ABR0R3I4_GOSAR|nr:hypothetical protein PVK06_002406 [Gossypium arboreum]